MRQRPPVDRPPESRTFVDQVLAALRLSRWRPRAWAAFLLRCSARSAQQMRCQPRAVLEVTVLHLALLPLIRHARLRLAASWVMAITHIGLLGHQRRSIGPANALSLLRANLPAGRWTPLVAIGTDVADGWLARLRTPTTFGAYADPLADVVFWSRQAWAHERSPVLRALAATVWLVPLAVIGGAYFVTGRTFDYPRPLVVRRLSAGLQCLLTVRAIRAVKE